MKQVKGLFEALFDEISRPDLKSVIVLPNIAENVSTYSEAQSASSENMFSSIDIAVPSVSAFDALDGLDLADSIHPPDLSGGLTLFKDLFDNPTLCIEGLIKALNDELGKGITDEIKSFVNIRTAEKLESIEMLLSARYKKINSAIDRMRRCSNENEKSLYLEEYLSLISPGEALGDLKKALAFNELKRDYCWFIEEMSSRDNGRLFLRYKWADNVYEAMQTGLLLKIEGLLEALELYAKAMTGEDGNISEYTAKLQSYLGDLELRYKHVLFTLYGGTLLNINRDLKVFGFQFKGLYLMSNHFTLGLTPHENEKSAEWANSTRNTIETLFNEKKYEEASIAISRLLDFLKANPVYSENIIIDGRNIMYLALTCSLALKNLLADSLSRESKEKFISFVKGCFSELYFLSDDIYIKSLGCPATEDILLEYISLNIKAKSQSNLLALTDYAEKIFIRLDNNEVYTGEKAADKSSFTNVLLILLFYVKKTVPGYQSVLDGGVDESCIRITDYLKLRHRYINVYGKDPFSSSLFGAAGKGLAVKLRKIFSMKRGLIPIGIALLLVVLLKFTPDIVESLKDFSAAESGKPEASEVNAQDYLYVCPTVDAANIRRGGGKSNPVLTVVLRGEVLTYLGEEMYDAGGTVWYQVKTGSGVIGWISSEVAEKK